MTFSPRYRALVYASLIASFLVVVWDGVVRVTGSGLGCPDWPLCHGQFLPSLDSATRIEWTHRFLAIVSGLTVAAMVLWTFVSYRGDRRVLWLAIGVAVLYPLQAVVGGITVLLELSPEWVTLHLANAELLLAALTILAVIVRWPALARERAPGWTWLILASAIGMFVVLLSGALLRGANATYACFSWPLCGAIALPLDQAPSHANVLAQRIDLPTSGAPLIAMLHRYITAVVGLALIAACAQAWRHRREVPGLGGAAIATALIFVLQVAIGAANPLSNFRDWALAAHPAAASLLWCSTVALAALAWRPMSGQGAAASGGASSLNHYFDRDIDERMRRTRHRPLPAHRISPRVAVVWGIALNVIAFIVLAVFANLLAAALALAGTIFYILVYTVWLKRSTAQNIVIGGAAGAIPPLVGWAAVTGSLDLSAWLLFAIVFFWTPAHFWALALLIRDDYARAGIPMLPVVQGDRATAWNILLYAASLVPLSLLLFVTGGLGLLYLAAAFVLGVVFVAWAVRLLRAAAVRQRAIARGLYVY